MFLKSKIKLAVILVFSLSVLSLLVHLYLATSSSGDLLYQKISMDDFLQIGQKHYLKILWGPILSLSNLRPYADPRKDYPVPSETNNRYIYAKVYGGFHNIQSSICDLVAISRLLNATLVIPEIQQSTRSKGISSRFNSFSYLYNVDHFIEALKNDVIVVKSLPTKLKEDRGKGKIETIQPQISASPRFYISKVLPKLEKAEVIGLIITDGGCLQPILPPGMDEYQRLRCRVAFNALHFRTEIHALGKIIVKRLRASGRPYLAYHPGLERDKLAFHGCAELFQDVHTELIQYQRSQLIKHGIIHEELNVDSMVRRRNGSCPLMPEEVGLLLRAMGYPPNTILYLAGSETFGGQRVLLPLRALYTNLLDRSSLCSEKELSLLTGQEKFLPPSPPRISSIKSENELIEEWKKSMPRPRPLPLPPSRSFHEHEQEGWYGWVAGSDKEPPPSPLDLRMQAHRLLWDALDYYVSVKANAFFSGFNNDGSKWPDFSSLVMGHRLYQTAASVTYRPDRTTIVELFDTILDDMYYPRSNWTSLVKQHLNKSLGLEGLVKQSLMSKQTSFLSYPLPECSCRISKVGAASIATATTKSNVSPTKEMDECPEWMEQDDKPDSSRDNREDDN